MTYPLESEALVAYGRGPKGDDGDVSAAQLAAAIATLKGTATSGADTLGELEALLALKAPLDGATLTNATHPSEAEGSGNTRLANTFYSDRAANNAMLSRQPVDALLTSVSDLSTSISGLLLFTGGVASVLTLNTSTSLAGASNTDVATSAAVKAYADGLIAANDAMVFKGALDCSSNPNYPAADRGHTYKVSVAGKIGGASGPNVEVGDTLLCITDGTAAGTHAAVGAQWNIVQANLDGAVIGPASVTDDLPAIFDGTSGRLIKSKSYAAFKTLLALVKGDVGLGSVDNTADLSKSVASAATLTTPRNIDGQSFNGSADIAVIAPGTHAAASKATPADADELPLVDSAAANVLKRLTWANLKATIKAYYDSVASTLTNKSIDAAANTITNLATSMFAANVIDTDGTLAANSDTRIASQKAVKIYVDGIIAAQDAMVFKGVIDCSSNPNYPAADRGHTYRVSVAGKIGGASGANVEAADILICLTDGTAAGSQATVGANWSIIQANLDGAVLNTRAVSTATGLSGGGNLTADRTISLDINALSQDSSPDSTADFMLTWDASAAVHKKVLPTSLHREKLTANRTYFVRTDGSDANNGLANSAGGAFLTLQKAVDTIAQLDIGIHNVTVQAGNGTYTGAIVCTGPWLGSGTVTFQGDTTTPSNAVINPTSATAVVVQRGCAINIGGFKITTTTGGDGLYATQGGIIAFSGKMEFGACGGSGAQMHATQGGRITNPSGLAYTISGNAAWHFLSDSYGLILVQLATVTLTGTPAFSQQFAYATTGAIVCNANTFSGSATGTRYFAEMNGTINSGGATLPGSGAGSTATGGQYI